MYSGIIYARLCRFRADLVLSYQTSPVLQALPALSHKKRTGAPLLLYCCDLWPESLKAWNVERAIRFFSPYETMEPPDLPGADRVAVTSIPFVEYLEKVLGLPRDRMVYLPQHAEDWFSSVACRYEKTRYGEFSVCGQRGGSAECGLFAGGGRSFVR